MAWLEGTARLMALALARELYAGQSARVAAALSAQRRLTPKQISERLGLSVEMVEAMIDKALSDPLDQPMVLTFLDVMPPNAWKQCRKLVSRQRTLRRGDSDAESDHTCDSAHLRSPSVGALFDE
ncbi:hypothetical protein [Saccharothrix sp. NRRL B-16314]|uniref:hypothetical protein n=1 Tax=Saccharothrix sp. NRRL B-16314 TaxID=1463825 RepID=UPI0012DCBB0D|nr:hypothetical protein [Saccharothrix sp. NRRL B-16314]